MSQLGSRCPQGFPRCPRWIPGVPRASHGGPIVLQSPPMDLVAGLGCACAGLVALALLVVAQRLGLLYRLCHKVDTASPRHGGELVAEVLRAHGVRFLFTLPGGHISPVLVACEKLGIRVVDTRHEATAVFAADAVSRLSGPVFVELPIDVLYPFHVVQKEIGGPKTPRGLRGKLVQWYLGNYLQDLFAGAWEPRDPTPLPLRVPTAAPEQVQRCAELLSRARRPLVLVGSQALLPPTPAEELRSALESLGVPCYLGGAARGLLSPECPLLLRQNRRDALRDADLVLLAGTVCDFRLSYGRLFGRGTAVVAVNRNRTQLLRNSDVFWKPRLALQGDPASFMVALARSLQDFSCPREWLERLREAERNKEQRNRDKAAVSPPCHLNPLALLQAVDQVLPPHSLLVADGGDFVGTAAYIVRPRRPLAWLDPGPFGTLGVGGGFALGAKLCRPEAEVWVLYGDGSLGFSLMEFDTFVRHKVPVIALVGNDAGWTQISREQLPLLGSAVGCGLAYSGDAGDTEDTEDSAGDRVVAVLRAAQAECHRGHPVLINALLGQSDFREGSVSV
uniref:2-hydroxyacyl-CoA lyase 2 n=1 Tax=Corvus moneduloides TaxID=1196302 RepID=A0A8U7P872_CORMO